MFIFLTTRLRERRDTGSTPLVGSSKKRTLGQCMRAWAQHSFLLLPPLRFLEIVFLKKLSSRVSMMSRLKRSRRSPVIPFKLAMKFILSSTVRVSQRRFSWLHWPKNLPIVARGKLLISVPISSAYPEVIESCMAIILKVVDFPAPFGPSKPKTSPFLAPNVFLQTAIFWPLG